MRDLVMFGALTGASYWLYANGVLEGMVLSLGNFMNLGVLAAGMFYASAVTSPLAIALFAAYAQSMSPLRIAMAGSVGALLADTVLFLGMGQVMKSEINVAGMHLKAPKPSGRAAKLFLVALGGILLAVPFPDELAILVLSFARLSLGRFALLSLACKFLGILGVAWALRII